MPDCRCACSCSCESAVRGCYPQQTAPEVVFPIGLLSKEKKQWYSFDESDAESAYEFQRKKRFGGRNGSDAIRHCLEWRTPRTSRNGLLDGEESDDDHKEGRVRTEGRPRTAKEPTPKVGQAVPHAGHGHTCQCTNAFEVSQLKRALVAQQAALERSEAAAQRLGVKAKTQQERPHVCGCGCVTTHATCAGCTNQHGRQQAQAQTQQQQQVPGQPIRAAWQHLPLDRVLDAEGLPRTYPSARASDGASTSVQAPSARFASELEGGSDAQNENLLSAEQHLQQQQQQAPPSSRAPASARATVGTKSSLKSGSTKKKAVPSSFTPRAVSVSASARQSQSVQPISGKGAGLGNTLLGSPHDPRSLHDPSSIDVVWRRREAARDRARKMQELLGPSASERPVVDAQTYEASILKQHARRLKIRDFAARHEEARLANPPAGATTRDYSETWMSVVTGRPPFCSFGNGNTSPATGGVVYGNYMLSHNVSPERRPNRPGQKQSTDEARRVAESKVRENARTFRRLLAAEERRETEERERARLAEAEALAEAQKRAGASAAASARAIGAAMRMREHYDRQGRASIDISNDTPRTQPPQPQQQQGQPQVPVTVPSQSNQYQSDAYVVESQPLQSNTLTETSARTASALPAPEAHPRQAW